MTTDPRVHMLDKDRRKWQRLSAYAFMLSAAFAIGFFATAVWGLG